MQYLAVFAATENNDAALDEGGAVAGATIGGFAVRAGGVPDVFQQINKRIIKIWPQ
jgi:hypothetical protein